MTTPNHLYHPSPSEPLSQTVVEAVADANGVDCAELDDRLYDCLDPDALDRLFAPAETSSSDRRGVVVFSMAGCRVEIRSDRVVTVTPTHDAEAPSELRA